MLPILSCKLSISQRLLTNGASFQCGWTNKDMVPATVRRVLVYVAVNTVGSLVNVVPNGKAGYRYLIMYPTLMQLEEHVSVVVPSSAPRGYINETDLKLKVTGITELFEIAEVENNRYKKEGSTCTSIFLKIRQGKESDSAMKILDKETIESEFQFQ
ncbi:unnamed protein product [Lupinus luteus]|uniref:Uncharacterized protein n=1 Tax=Lupinus luteus TaxID=3873 RepID=A0AAV1WYI4_LUPLU